MKETAEIVFDQEGNPYFTVFETGSVMYLEEFIRTDDGKAGAHLSNIAWIQIEIDETACEVTYEFIDL